MRSTQQPRPPDSTSKRLYSNQQGGLVGWMAAEGVCAALAVILAAGGALGRGRWVSQEEQPHNTSSITGWLAGWLADYKHRIT